MGLSEHVTRERLRGLLGLQSTPDRRGRSEPPGAYKKEPGSQWSGAAPFHPENPGRLSFFLANPDRRDTYCLVHAEVSAAASEVSWQPLHIRPCSASQPAAAVCWDPWSLRAASVYRSIQIGVAGLTVWHRSAHTRCQLRHRTERLIPHGIPDELQATFQKSELEPPDALW